MFCLGVFVWMVTKKVIKKYDMRVDSYTKHSPICIDNLTLFMFDFVHNHAN